MFFSAQRKRKKPSSSNGVPPEIQARANHTEALLISAAIAAYLGKSPDQFTIHADRVIFKGESPWSQMSRRELLQ